jgi:hypothetical protein
MAQALALGAVLAQSTAAGPATGPATITISDVQTASALVRHRRGAFAPGEVEIIQRALFNRRASPRPIGYAWILCTLVTRDTSDCTSTYLLPRGEIVTSGSLGSQLLYEVPIVGGTELYDDARGSLVVTTTRLKPRQELLVFRLTG